MGWWIALLVAALGIGALSLILLAGAMHDIDERLRDLKDRVDGL